MRRPNMVGRTNHFKHTPGMGCAMLFLAGCVLFGIPIALTLLVFVINAPWILIPIIGIVCLISYINQRRANAEREKFAREANESQEQFERELVKRLMESEEEVRRRDQDIVDWLHMERRDQNIVDWLEMRRRERE